MMPTGESLGPVGFAIIGTGAVADYHRWAIAANAERGARLVAVGHHDPARFDELGARFGVSCLEMDDLLSRPDVDVVCICTPSGLHAGQTIAAARAGKHVICEKPLALNLEDADAMIEACDRAGVRLSVVLQRRAEPLFVRVREAIQAGDLGDLTLASVTIPYQRSEAYYQEAAWRGIWALDGGGVLMNQGIHLVDLLVWYTGDPVEVRAHAGTLRHEIEVEDTLTATLRFKGGALATVTATTTAAPGFPHRIEVYGTRGGIQIEGESVRRWELEDPGKAIVEPPEVGTASDAGAWGDARGIAPTGHINLFRDFIEALNSGRTSIIDGVQGRRSLAAVLSIYEAAGLRSPDSGEMLRG
jgi:predicted dehydrogenase